eukprot:SM000007S20992  [mRNA]  locus=s7:1420981:1424843:+ [translate_table: standard]
MSRGPQWGGGGAAVLYHYPCPDGAFAALAAHLYYAAAAAAAAAAAPPVRFVPNTVYSPVRCSPLGCGAAVLRPCLHARRGGIEAAAACCCRVDDLGDVGSLEVVYLLDFAGPPGFAHDLAANARSVVVLDHHKTSAASLLEPGACPSNLSPVFDFDRSGATIALDYFTKRLLAEGLGTDLVAEKDIERLRRLFAYIEDADLWLWHLTDSKAFSSGLNDLQLEFDANKNPEIFNQLQALVPEDVIVMGKKIMLPRRKQIDGALGASFIINLGQGRFGSCLAVRVDDALSRLRSDIGHELAERSRKVGLRGIGTVVYLVPDLQDSSMLKVSLRSLDEIEEDTTPISEAYGGGGHRAASSFMIAADEFACWMRDLPM